MATTHTYPTLTIPTTLLLLLLHYHLLPHTTSLSLVHATREGAVQGEARVEGADDVGSGRRKELVPAMFAFGDSLIDNGNNNNLPSFAKANYYPYGIDFAAGPTGRFSNGYTIVDEIANLLGLPLIPPYSEAAGEDQLHGVNYASAAAGILDITGRNFTTLDRITNDLGADAAADAIGRCIFFVGMGSNDYLNNYLMPNYDTRSRYNGEQFAELLVQQFARQLTVTRKLVVSGVGSMGCIPSMLARDPHSRCSPDVDRQLILPFNSKVRSTVNALNVDLPHAKLIYVDIYAMFTDILTSPASYGFSVTDRACCGIGRNAGEITCLPFQTPCANRDEYVFWDAFHPTAAVNIILAKQAFYGSPNVVFPINILQLANLELDPKP
ncbi:GDSL esterase/lipase [Ananas comosus]|uniref:GDSL esterase/lipase n=1 Tax=Ananas comosus TaxID=4615 RepID=A0A199W1K0_ANACO|nr:GDSL esterase/lipase [Ananas comosus]